MDKLPHSLLLEILSRLDDSADVARCRMAYRAFDTAFPGLRSINFRCSNEWFLRSRFRVSNSSNSYKKIFLDLISKMETVESVSITHSFGFLIDHKIYLTYEEFVEECLARVSQSLKSLSLFSFPFNRYNSNILLLISAHCNNLVSLKLHSGWLYVDNMNPMPMLTTLTLESLRLEDKHLNQLNKCFPNLQVLNLLYVTRPRFLKINLLNLKTCHCHWGEYNNPSSLTLITPNLLTLTIECLTPAEIHVEAPMLSHFHLRYNFSKHAGAFTTKNFENLRTLRMDSLYLSSLLSEFPITKTVKNLTLDSGKAKPTENSDSKLTIGKVFMVFPNLSSLFLKSNAWLEVEASMNQEGWGSFAGRKGLKRICAYLKLGDPSRTFSSVACMLDQCVSLSEVSLLVHVRDVGHASHNFRSKCMARWPELKWRWGIWSEIWKDIWISKDPSRNSLAMR